MVFIQTEEFVYKTYTYMVDKNIAETGRKERKATSALTGFHAGPLSWSIWNLEMLVFVEEGKPENPEKNARSKERTNNKLNPHMVKTRDKNPKFKNLFG